MAKKKIIETVISNDPQTKRWRATMSAARMAYDTGEFRQAESLLARALEGARELPEKSFAVNATEAGISAALLAQGKTKEAQTRASKVVSTLEGYADTDHQELLAVALRFRAQALLDSGADRDAEKDLLRSADILRSIGAQGEVQLAYTLCDLCGLYLTQGRLSEADKYIHTAMNIASATLGSDSPEYVRADMIYQSCAPMTGEARLETVSDGIQKMEYWYGANHPNISRAVDRYIKVLEERGDTARLEEATNRFGLRPKAKT